MILDLRTLLVVLVVTNLLMACTLWLAFSGSFRDGLGKWIAGSFVQGAAWALLSVRGWIPEVLTVATAHSLLALSFSLQAAALMEFHGRRAPPWLVGAPAVLLFAAISISPDNLVWRSVVSNVVYGTLFVFIVWTFPLPESGGRGRAHQIMIGAYATAALVCASRIAAWLLDPGAFQPGATPAQAVAFLGAAVIMLLVSVGFLLMHKERSDEAIRRLATTDPLTGVFNRRTFIELAERELARCRRKKEPLRLLMLDLDHFKRVNDTHGHMAGDEVLAGFARTVAARLRKTDLFVRYGGEEFCVLLPGADEQGALILAERIRAAVDGTMMPARGGSIHVTVSVGLCGGDAADIASLDHLLDCADQALYQAKKAGRNRVIASALEGAELNAA